ncbi:hypothetical protein [Brucella rhizosphaerae]|uniref:hypothetical protein n=1 Tax=Brucella rhizosphaerae TaxID=571254 RepID=UPI0004AF0383|nr:hypothetical protein [Brucella rhizosphaerae]
MTTKSYRARPGVEWVNGARVPATRKVNLSEAEARFDLDHGRIEPSGAKLRAGDGNGGGEGNQDGRD